MTALSKMTSKTKHFSRPLLLAAALFFTSSSLSHAGSDAVIYRGAAPEAGELADILFPKKQPKTRGIKTRGIRFKDESGGAEAAAPAPQGFGFNIEFAFDSVDVLPSSRPYLDRVGEMLKLEQAAGQAIIVQGHTDARGSSEYNRELSVRRAEAVAAYLESQHGIESRRLQVAGLGESSPLASTDPEDAANRRVEFFPAQ